MSSNIINFSTNWNNKLNCTSFTTLRLKNSNKYQIGREYEIRLKNKFKKNATIQAIKTTYCNQINEFIAHIDTGYSAQETQNIIKKMYPKIDLEKQPLSFILLKSVK